MASLVVTGAQLKCSFGVSPGAFIASGAVVNGTKKPVGVMTDNVPMKNIAPFGMCTSASNPTVAAALGVPQTCVPVIAAPWAPGAGKVTVGKVKAVLDNCKLICSWGGQIEVTNAGQTKATGK